MVPERLVRPGAGEMVFVSDDFAASWPQGLSFSLPPGSGSVYALAFASASRLFIGTTSGQVFRADRAAGSWTLTRLDNADPGLSLAKTPSDSLRSTEIRQSVNRPETVLRQNHVRLSLAN